MRRFALLAVILGVFTMLLLTWNVSLATSVPYPSWSSPPPDFDIAEVNPNPIISYKATEISQPLTYWTLTEPIDPYILYAIFTRDTWIPCRENETFFLQQVEEHNGVWKIEYQESYYEIEALALAAPHPTPARYADGYFEPLHLIPHTAEHVSSAAGLGGLWSLLTIVWVRKRNIP